MANTTINVFGSAVCNARTKAAAVLATQASVEGQRVLLTERNSADLRRFLHVALVPTDNLELYYLAGVPKDRLLVALINDKDQAASTTLTNLAANYDLVIISNKQVPQDLKDLSKQDGTKNVFVGGYDGLLSQHTLAHTQQLGACAFIAAVPDKLPKYYDNTIANATTKLANLPRHVCNLPLFSYSRFGLPKGDELRTELWSQVSQFISNLKLIKNAKAGNSKPDSKLLATAQLLHDSQKKPTVSLQPLPGPALVTEHFRAHQAPDVSLAAKLTTHATTAKNKTHSDSEARNKAYQDVLAQVQQHHQSMTTKWSQDHVANKQRSTAIRAELATVAQQDRIRIDTAAQALSARLEDQARIVKERLAATKQTPPKQKTSAPTNKQQPVDHDIQETVKPNTQEHLEPQSDPKAQVQLRPNQQLAKKSAAIAKPVHKPQQQKSQLPTQAHTPAPVSTVSKTPATTAPPARPQQPKHQVSTQPSPGQHKSPAMPSPARAPLSKESNVTQPQPSTQPASVQPQQAKDPYQKSAQEPQDTQDTQDKLIQPPAADSSGHTPAAPVNQQHTKRLPTKEKLTQAQIIAQAKAKAKALEQRARTEQVPVSKTTPAQTSKAATDPTPTKDTQSKVQSPAKHPDLKTKDIGKVISHQVKSSAKQSALRAKPLKAEANSATKYNILRKKSLEFTHLFNREELAKALDLQQLGELFKQAQTNLKFDLISLDDNQITHVLFSKISNLFLRQLSSNNRTQGGAYAIALQALLVAQRAHDEENYSLEKIVREFANEAFTAIIPSNHSLAHWCMNIVWLSEHQLFSGKFKEASETINNLLEVVFTIKPGMDSEKVIKVMRAVLALLMAHVEAKLTNNPTSVESKRSFEIAGQLMAEVPAPIAEAIVLPSDPTPTNDRVQASTQAAKQAFGDMV